MALDAKILEPVEYGAATGQREWTRHAVAVLGFAWLLFQFWIFVSPQQPLIERPLHLVFALILLFLVLPQRKAPLFDVVLIGASAFLGFYFVTGLTRLTSRVEAVDPILPIDLVAGVVLLFLLLEGVRRTVGWSLLGLLLFTLFYNFAGPWFPGWSRFSGFDLKDTIEIMTMTTNGVLGVTTETSVQFVFYFLVFGSVYSAIGGGRLFIDIGMRVAGRQKAGAAKAAVISSALMGTISGSAVANVVSVGVFTIPLMRRAGYSKELAAGIEAISSTGGQLMPPVMGVAAFVMAEILQIDYGKVALAAFIPAVAFYFALFVIVDLMARKTGIGNLPADAMETQPLLPRLYLLIPPILLIGLLASGRSATWSVIAATGGCIAVGYLRRRSWLGPRDWLRTVDEIARQACQVAIPIAAIGIIVAVAVQSNLALRFSSRLIEGGGGNVYLALALTILGCIVMGMGLPTVAAYIIGAILFAPALVKLGLAPLAAHFFVMYYCVLSMITPPVALASFASAGLAGASAMSTGWQAFRLSFVLFLIPFGFAFDLSLLGQGPAFTILFGFLSLLAATGAWAVALIGYLGGSLSLLERLLFGAASVAMIFYPTLSRGWFFSVVALVVLIARSAFLYRRRARV
ncbi:MAG TPA: TRAP transporter fused permease subunit [Bryobacteraceae bacterium]|nr:TRAP transporter fused permease subunit [Bryobacteraceae bacterium]